MYWRGNARVNAKEEDGEYVKVDGVVGAVLVLDKIFRISSIDSNTIEKLLLGSSIQKKFGRHSSKEKFILNQIFRKIPPGIIISGDDKKRIIRISYVCVVLRILADALCVNMSENISINIVEETDETNHIKDYIKDLEHEQFIKDTMDSYNPSKVQHDINQFNFNGRTADILLCVQPLVQ
ncbi:hypothetical protein HZH66_002617 [Vespula vulgaris]|uniref:Uncharacterized protein n=1 Tax=Vespula vulgaris TaxID=7454 RepID=A0A834NGE6_VESVU|nr:hypothetical protein HZH66_002617 [Vespula vulgaris]